MQNLKILLVEDSPADKRLIFEFIKDIPKNLEVDSAGTLADAAVKLKTAAYNLVLTDLDLPDSSGLNTLTAVMEAAPYLPVIVLTGLYDDEMGEQAVLAGAEDYIIKGDFNARSLYKSIIYAVERNGIKNILKQREENLLSLNSSLKAAEAELIEGKKKAEELNRVKSVFLSNMSHELRTPLVGILGFSEMLETELPDPEYKGVASMILENGRRLLDTVNSILDITRIEAEHLKPEFEMTEIVSLTKEAAANYCRAAEMKGLKLTGEYPAAGVVCNVDPEKFTQVLNNLINNAVKYTSEGSICVSVGTVNADGVLWAEVTIADTGIGIPDEYSTIIFEEFRQVSEGLSRRFEGAGLGLTIVKKYTEMMNGRVHLSSSAGKGSTFKLLFPCEGNRAAEDGDYGSGGAAADVNRILVVDDEQDAVEIVRYYLKDICDVDSASSFNEIVERLSLNNYDAILMDINLGRDLDGLDIVKKLKAAPVYAHVPIIAFTAYAMKYEPQFFFDAGCSGYLAKPFTSKELRRAVLSVKRQENIKI